MTDPQPARRYRFGSFEVDASAPELRRQGIRLKLNAQPFQVLCLLLERPGALVTREEISRELWPDGTFVDYEHGVNSAVNRIREALGDTANNPRFVETLARRGYRFVAPVERIEEGINGSLRMAETAASKLVSAGSTSQSIVEEKLEHGLLSGILASPHELPKASFHVVQTLFVLLQIMYLGFYVGALTNLVEIEDLISVLPKEGIAVNGILVSAAILIPVRAFVLAAILFHAPKAREQFLKLWPFLVALDVLWALSPFLLLHHISFGLALACTVLLVYSPFAQRSLVLMGAGGAKPESSQTAR
jgi:DNA-binding winged helix-turn-helix (wHTH) protein